MQALECITVLDLSGGYPMAFGTQILADLGAKVINIEGRSGLSISHRGKKDEAAHESINRNKDSIILNLKTEQGSQIFYRLSENADVIVDPFKPGTAARLGIDYATIRKINPKIIYCAVSGYGQTGPYRDLPGHDINYISMAGALDLIGEEGGRPIIPLNLIGDLGGAALHAVIGILAALIARDKTGNGQYIDVSYTDSVLSLLSGSPIVGEYFLNGVPPKRGRTTLGGVYPYYAVYETKDRKFITIGCLETKFWENFCRAIGKDDFLPFHFESKHLWQQPANPKFNEILGYLRKLFLTKTRDEWFELLRQNNVPVGKVYSLDEVSTDPQVINRKMILEFQHPTAGTLKQPGIAIKLSDTPGEIRSLPPYAGEHTDEILNSLGYTESEISHFHNLGIVA
jgi:crotonobetainyl-CoA:carnitine CoA-transferase CaiB-like acyl-CoA transferase